jgi:dihydrofolate reductase
MSFGGGAGLHLRHRISRDEEERPMAVYTGASMSLDGYISGPNESGFEHLFKWYNSGDVVVKTAQEEFELKMSLPSAEHWKANIDRTGALVVGRKLFNLTNGWGGKHPMGVPVVVLTHNVPDDQPVDGEWFHFVTDGIEAAVARAQEIAGDKAVGVNGGVIASQCLDAKILDEIWVELVPVLLGGGVPFFDHLKNVPVVLEGPVSIVEGEDVTHLRYRVRYE